MMWALVAIAVLLLVCGLASAGYWYARGRRFMVLGSFVAAVLPVVGVGCISGALASGWTLCIASSFCGSTDLGEFLGLVGISMFVVSFPGGVILAISTRVHLVLSSRKRRPVATVGGLDCGGCQLGAAIWAMSLPRNAGDGATRGNKVPLDGAKRTSC